MKLILGSTSPFRKALLEKLHIDFDCDSPDIDETPLENEPVEDMVVRLAIAKAQAISTRHPNALIIGSDQSAVLNGKKLSKPGNFENAFKQLTRASGQKIFSDRFMPAEYQHRQYSELLCALYRGFQRTDTDHDRKLSA